MSRMLVVLAAAAAAVAGVAHAETVTADLKNGAGQTIGTVSLTEAPKGVLMRVEAKGLTPGWHGLHFHEKADCSKSDFTSAGAHTRHQGHGDAKAVHGLLNAEANETGDLPNIHAGADGAATAEVFTTLTTLSALRDGDGSAVLIHANADDHKTQPIGGAGARVACALVK